MMHNRLSRGRSSSSSHTSHIRHANSDHYQEEEDDNDDDAVGAAHKNGPTTSQHPSSSLSSSRVFYQNRPTLRGKKIFQYLLGAAMIFLLLGYWKHNVTMTNTTTMILQQDGGNNKLIKHHPSTMTVLNTKIESTDTSHPLATIWTQDDLAADKMKPTSLKPKDDNNNNNNNKSFLDRCQFRTYMPHRLYGLHHPSSSSSSLPSFLTTETKYIRGKWPFILHPQRNDDYHKVCIDQSEWDNDHPDRWPFGDGQNPSILSLVTADDDTKQQQRLDYNDKTIHPLISYLTEQQQKYSVPQQNMFLGVTVLGNAKCAWNMTPSDLDQYQYSPLNMNQKPTEQSLLLILNEDMKTIYQAPLLLEQDADWGTKKRNKIPMKKNPSTTTTQYQRSIQQLDDPRLFYHQGKVFVLYRNGPKFGYEQQIQNPIHFEKITQADNDEMKLVAYIKASETFTVCCGRNIAFLSEKNNENDDTLKALVWIDPVTVETVNLPPMIDRNNRRLSSVVDEHHDDGSSSTRHFHESNYIEQTRRKLGSQQEKSNIHGTNGYMVPLHSTNEYLGIAHFHRPEHRQKSDYALHGHHYTHAFFTIAKTKTKKGDDKYVLKRLSNEFLFPTQSSSSSSLGNDEFQNDGDMIQFASGIDLIGSDDDTDGKIIISYGINDCEGAVLSIDIQEVQSLLLELDDHENEVIDLMKKLDSVS